MCVYAKFQLLATCSSKDTSQNTQKHRKHKKSPEALYINRDIWEAAVD